MKNVKIIVYGCVNVERTFVCWNTLKFMASHIQFTANNSIYFQMSDGIRQ